MIKISHLTKIYHGIDKTVSVTALDDISLEFSDNGLVAILGASGSGKSTLLNLIGGLDNFDSGEIEINEKKMSTFKEADYNQYRNQTIGFVFQNYCLIDYLSVYDNISMTLSLNNTSSKEIKSKVMDILEKVGLKGKENKHPYELSGGEKQRVAIARAIVNSPRIILADEPTGSLDSKTASQITSLLKELSKDYLVLMVTHNETLAKELSDRIITLKDGKIINEETYQASKAKENITLEKVHLSFKRAILIGLKHLWKKKIQTIWTILATCIGLIGVGLVLSVSSAVNDYISNVQENALSNHSINVYSSLKPTDYTEKDEVYERYPNSSVINVVSADNHYDHINYMETDFIDYINAMNISYKTIKFIPSLNYRLYYKDDNYYSILSNSYFNMLSEDTNFISDQYEMIAGNYPSTINDVVLLVDEYNCIDAYTLYSLGIDYSSEEFTFDDLVGYEYKYISNNDYYTYDSESNTFKVMTDYNTLYNNSNVSLKISGIMRPKKDATTLFYDPGLLCTKAFYDFALNDALNSDIVVSQKEYGVDYNVLTGSEFKELETLTSTYSVNYQYEQQLISFGCIPRITSLSIYTSTFENRLEIVNYIDNYDNENSNVVISIYDRISTATTDLASLVKTFSSIVMIFAAICLLVSAILIGILSYISVFERSKEIGIMRSLGARKIDISYMFSVESIIVGFLSGVLGIAGTILLINPINSYITSLISKYYISSVFTTITTVNASFNIGSAILLILSSIFLTFIASLLPAILASKKRPIEVLKTE